MIPKETVDTIIETARIEEVVGDFVTLKKRGVNLLGLCPFHNEKSPSFTVSPAKGIYKCFGCAKAGNSVSFIMEHEHYSYPEALKYLARKYNIEIEDEGEISAEEQQAHNEKESLYVVSSYAQRFFTETLLKTDEGKSIGLSYFKERGFSPETIEKFQLGYSPANRTALTEAAPANGYKTEYLVKAGLLIQADNGNVFDRFVERVMFPVHNISGRVIAFGGRTLKTDKKIAKYINSPETEIYHKSNVLYGAFFAKKSIIQNDVCLLVEGYTDVISLHQAGIENVVASSGTSLTVEQIKLIKRYTPNITILYDGDAAGIKASFRGIDLILEEGMNVKIVLFPDGEDPDSFARKNSEPVIKEFIKNNASDFIVFKSKLLLEETKNDPIKKAGFIKEIISSIALIDDGITRSVYVKECSTLLDISEQTLINELNRIRKSKFAGKIQKEDPVTEHETPVVEKQEKLESKFSTEQEEKDIIRLLISYGNKTFTHSIKDEKGRVEEMELTVAPTITHMLRVEDGIEFDHPVYNAIFNEFCKGVEENNIPSEAYFLNHSDKTVNEAVIDILTSRYSLSEGWEKHNIIVHDEGDDLNHTVFSAVYALKLKKVMVLINQNQEQLKSLQPDDDLFPLIEEQKMLIESKKALSKHLGRVVLK